MVRINNFIRASELRVVDDEGNNLGIITLSEALKMAKEKELDLIEVSPNAKPPIAKIMDYGKYQYLEKKKEKQAKLKAHTTETKSVQVGMNTSQNDLELKAKKLSEFLKEGNRAKVELTLKGRSKYMNQDFLKERLSRLLNLVTEKYKIAYGPNKSPRGIMVIIEKEK